jgi:hypothetical protein
LDSLQHVVWHFDLGQVCPESLPVNTVISLREVHKGCVEFAAVVGSPGFAIRGKMSKDKHWLHAVPVGEETKLCVGNFLFFDTPISQKVS